MDRRRTDRRNGQQGDLYILDIHAIAGIFARRRALFLGFMLMLLIPACLLIAMRPKNYVAHSSVIVENEELNLTDFRDMLPAKQLDPTTIETQVKVIASSTLIHETLATLAKEKNPPAIAANARDAEGRYVAMRSFSKNLAVAPDGRSRVISIAYKAQDPYEAAKIVNTHTEQYIAFQIRNKKEQIAQINDWITQQIAALREDSQKKSQEIQQYRKEAGIVLGKNSQELILQQIEDLTEQLVPVETEKLNLQARSQAVGSTAEIVDSNLISNLKQQLSDAQQELRSLRSVYGPKHPDVLAAKQRVNQASADINRESGTIKNSVKTELAAATEQEMLIRTRLEELNQEADDLREKAILLESLEAEETANRTLLESFLTRSEELKSQLGYDNTDVRVVSLAEVPIEASGASKAVLGAIALIFSTLAAAALVLTLELIDRGIENPDDIKKILNLKLLGSLPKSRTPLTDVGSGQHSDYLEELKRIYLTLSQNKAPQAILVTSAREKEGKSTVALSLARYLASIQAKPVLIDVNTVNPSVNLLADIKSGPGYADILKTTTELSQVIQKDDYGVPMIAAGVQPGQSADILASDRFARMLETLKAQYDYVILDAAAVSASTDAEIMAGLVDQVIIVAEYAKTPKALLKKIGTLLRQYSRDVPLIIINKKK